MHPLNRKILAAVLGTAFIAGFPHAPASAEHASPPLTILTVPNWGHTDIPPFGVALSLSWRKVVVHRSCHRTVRRVWERHAKGPWVLVAKHVRRHPRSCDKRVS